MWYYTLGSLIMHHNVLMCLFFFQRVESASSGHESRKGIFDWSQYGLKDEDGE
jgi:hypothetical protein